MARTRAEARDYNGILIVIQSAKHLYVRSGQPGILRYVAARLKFASVPHEIVDDVPAIAEVIHDVFKSAGVLQADGMSHFMDACEVNNRVSQQYVLSRTGGQRLTLQ